MVASSLAQSISCAKIALVASFDGDPFRGPAPATSVLGIHRAAGGAVPGEHHVIALRDGGEIGDFAVIGGEDLQVGQFELLYRILDPDIAGSFPTRRP